MKALLVGLGKAESQVETFNTGSDDWMTVKTVADIVVDEIGLENVDYRFTRGVNRTRGWVGDVENALHGTSRPMSRGCNPRRNGEQSVRRAVREILLRVGDS